MMSNKINLFSIWLLILGVLVISIIIIGGYTRISDSGLSITEWQPISGILYPFSNQSWLNEFSKYKLTDEFKLINSNMTLVEFKFIYFWEWFHRFFARLIGVIFLIPLLVIIFKNQFPKQFTIHICLIGLFLMTQAVVGWYMVKSGLVDRVDVSQYRLSLHLTLAFIILGLIFYTLLMFFSERFDYYDFMKIDKILLSLFILIFFQIIYGAFVSGTDSGLLYNTWPSYNGNLLPNIMIVNNGYINNFFENKELILFVHRTFAVILFGVVIYLNYLIISNFVKIQTLVLIIFFDILFLIQGAIGILMTFHNIPWHLALAHQGNSIILFLLSLYMWFLSKKPS